MASLAASVFERARQALVERNFEAAITYAKEAEVLVCADLQVGNFGAPASPTCSVIVVLYQRHSDLSEALRRLSRYSNQPEFELILVNNSDFRATEILQYCGQFRWIDVGFNYGCSGGRNYGARVARGQLLAFVDDDGFIEENAIEHLVGTITEHDALTVRGRVLPKNNSRFVVPHYDLGDEVVYSAPNAEGVSIWRRQEFIDNGGFDTLLAGGEGLALWSKMYKSHPLAPFLYTPHAKLLHDYGADAEKLARKQAKDTPNWEYFHLAYPGVLQLRWQAALAFTERAVERDPQNATLRHHLGNLLQKCGRLGDAEAAHRRAIEINPYLVEAHRQLSISLAKQNRQDEALAAARRAIECDPHDAQHHYHLGKLLQRWLRVNEAELAYRRTIELNPNHAEAHWLLSVILTGQGCHDEALAAARRAIECDPENAEIKNHFSKLMQFALMPKWRRWTFRFSKQRQWISRLSRQLWS